MANEFLYVQETVASVRSKIVGYAQSGSLLISNWIGQAIGLQLLETLAPTVQTFTAIAAQAARGFASLDTSTDPGDVDPYDPTNATLAPAPGYLTDIGNNVFGTPRIGQTFATGTINFLNTGTGQVSQTFAPYALTFQRNYADPSTGLSPTYRNADGYPTYQLVGGGTLAANPDHSLTVGAGVSVVLPIICETLGSTGSATMGTITIQGNSLPGVTVTNAAAVIGADRQPAPDYRSACRLAPAAVSPNGPADAYRYIALGAQQDAAGNTFYFPTASSTALGIDSNGNLATFPSPNGTSLGVTRVYVSTSSATGNVSIYMAGAAGGSAISGAVTPIQNLINAVYWPDATTRTFNAAIDTTVTVTSTTIKAKAGPGVTAASVAANIGTALANFFEEVPIGGYDQTAGAGTLYLDQIRAVISGADPSIYHVVLSSPASDTALALGHDAVLTNNIVSGSITVA